jgi:hypothetical protein
MLHYPTFFELLDSGTFLQLPASNYSFQLDTFTGTETQEPMLHQSLKLQMEKVTLFYSSVDNKLIIFES